MAWCAPAARCRQASKPAGGQERAKHQRAPGCLPLHQRGGGQWRARKGLECDSFPVLRNLSQGREALSGPAFSAHSWLYCRSNIGYQAARRCHALAAFRGERAGRRGDRLSGREAASGARKKGQIAMDHRIASARPFEARADRFICCRGIAGGGHGRGDPALAQQSKPATKPAAEKTGTRQAGCRACAGRTGAAATGHRGAAATYVFAVDKGVRQGSGNQ